MLEFRRLQVFVALMEEGSFSREAHRCHLSQPTVSGHIKDLEKYFGVLLFDRHTREVVPTRAAHLLYRYAKRILELGEEMKKEMFLFASGGKGLLQIGGSNIPGQYLLPEFLGLFKKDHPKVEICLKIADTKEIVQEVSDGGLEIGVVGAKIDGLELSFEPCFEDEIVFVVPSQQEFPSRLDLDSLREVPLVVREKGSGSWHTVKENLQKAGLSVESLNIVAEMSSTEAVKQAVKAGIGGAFVSWRAVKDEIENKTLRLVPIEGLEIKRFFYLVTRRRRSLSPAAQDFIEFFKTASGAPLNAKDREKAP